MALPLISAPLGVQTSVETLVDQILATKAADPDADTTNLAKEIGKWVYALYNLTEEEIAIVEGLSKSRLWKVNSCKKIRKFG